MIRDYIILASGCFIVGVVIALATIAASIRWHINILGESAWMLAIPAVLAIVLNITLIEIYHKFKKRK
jgi:cytochrome c biogenesis protein CcdA